MSILISFITPLLVGRHKYYPTDTLRQLGIRKQQTAGTSTASESESERKSLVLVAIIRFAHTHCQLLHPPKQAKVRAVLYAPLCASTHSNYSHLPRWRHRCNGDAADTLLAHCCSHVCGAHLHIHLFVHGLLWVSALIEFVFARSQGFTIRPFARTAAGFMYFHILYNAVLIFWAYGYWPLGSEEAATRPLDDRTALVNTANNPFSGTGRDEEEL